MIEINNLTKTSVEEVFLKKAIKLVLKEEGIDVHKLSFSVAFVQENRMVELNREYRRKNKPTDVLSFRGNLLFPEKSLGEIIICLKAVRDNAKESASPFEKELACVLVHGTLHLLGYNHEESEKEAKKMFELQNLYLQKIFKNKKRIF